MDKKDSKPKIVEIAINVLKTSYRLLTILLIMLYLLLILTIPVFLLYKWNFAYAENIIGFLKVSWWPLIVILMIILFKGNIAKFLDEIIEVSFPWMKARRDKNLSQPSKIEDPNLGDQAKDNESLNEMIKEQEKKLEDLNNTQATLQKDLAETKLELEFERIYNTIFKTQIELLELLIVKDQTEFSSIAEYFNNVVSKQYPIYKYLNWDINFYLRYLFNVGLISQNNTWLKLTPKGKAFLFYVRNVMHYEINSKSL